MCHKCKLDNKSPPFSVLYNKSFEYISKWKLDKVLLNHEDKRVKKIEVYNYFWKKDLKKLLRYLNTKKFSYNNDTKNHPCVWNPQLANEWKYTTGQWKRVDEMNKPKYYYYTHFCKVLVHRNRVYLLKIYENKSSNKDFVKLEITYEYHKKNYNLHYLDWLSALKGMNEIIGKICKKATVKGFDEDFSRQITLDSLIYQVMGNLWPTQVNHVYKIFNILGKTK